jgi:hypothetical protein
VEREEWEGGSVGGLAEGGSLARESALIAANPNRVLRLALPALAQDAVLGDLLAPTLTA